MNRRTLVVADIFCGAGGLSTGFATASPFWDNSRGEGYQIAFATDKDKQAMQTFRANHFRNTLVGEDDQKGCFCGDVGLVDGDRVRSSLPKGRQVDVLIGGPSCQGVSPAGLRNPGDKRNQMLLAFARLVKELKPLWFVLENVPGLTHANNRELLAGIFKLFEESGEYKVAGDVLLAADYGVPQLRYRLFIIGTRSGNPIRFPVPKCTNENSYPTVRDAIGDLNGIDPLEYDEGESPAGEVNGFKNHWCRRIGELERKRIAGVRQGRDWRDIPVALLPDRYFMTRSSDQKGSYGRLLWDWPAYTVTNLSLNVSAGAFTHPDHDRCLSVRELARVQSFDDNYKFYGSVEAQYRQVGNAVPPKLARAVAEGILICQFDRKGAKNWGREGRLTSELLEECNSGRLLFPTMTPRRVHPSTARSTKRKSPQSTTSAKSAQIPSVWLLDQRPGDPWPGDSQRLRKLAEQPKNIRAAKRARAIVQYLDGISRSEIVEKANVSEESVRKWIDGYFARGLDGWRAFHSSLGHLAGDNEKIRLDIAKKIASARKVLLEPHRGNVGWSKRLHMNGYLLKLIRRFGHLSVDQLTTQLEGVLGTGLGTIYVGDLLALSDVVLSSYSID